MATQSEKQTRTIKKILFVILFAGAIWMCVDSLCEYVEDRDLTDLFQVLFYLLYIIFFGWMAVAEYKRHKDK